MPTYDYKCSVCSRGREVFLKLQDLDSTVWCQKCGHAMNRQISAPAVLGDYEPYESPVQPGKWIHGRRQHEEHLRETGCRILEPGEDKVYQRRLAREEAELEAKIEETADRFIAELPTEKRDRLAAEMDGGLAAEVVRSTPQQPTV